MTQSPRKAKVLKDRFEPTKAPTPLPIDPEEGEDDQTSPKSYTRGETYHEAPDNGSRDTNEPTKMIDEPKPKSTAPRRSGRARRLTTF